jgi:hypothetical protein
MRVTSRLNAPKWGIFFKEAGARIQDSGDRSQETVTEVCLLSNHSGTGKGKGTGIGSPTKKGEL